MEMGEKREGGVTDIMKIIQLSKSLHTSKQANNNNKPLGSAGGGGRGDSTQSCYHIVSKMCNFQKKL